MRILLVLLSLMLVFVMAGCAGKYSLSPEDQELLDSAITAAKDAKASAASANAALDKVSQEAHGAMQSAARTDSVVSKAESAAGRAERAANRAERAADAASLAAEKAVKAFEMGQRK